MTDRPEGCKCDFRTYMVGDGCQYCNPQKAIEYLQETVSDLEAELARLMEKHNNLHKTCHDLRVDRDSWQQQASARAQDALDLMAAERERCAKLCERVAAYHSAKAEVLTDVEEAEFREAEACGAEDCVEAIRMGEAWFTQQQAPASEKQDTQP